MEPGSPQGSGAAFPVEAGSSGGEVTSRLQWTPGAKRSLGVNLTILLLKSSQADHGSPGLTGNPSSVGSRCVAAGSRFVVVPSRRDGPVRSRGRTRLWVAADL